MAKITILGAGGFGVSLAIAAFQNGHTVTVWDISQQIVDAILRDGEHKTKLPGVRSRKASDSPQTLSVWNTATWWFLWCRPCISVPWHSV